MIVTKITITKFQRRVPPITLSDQVNLSLFKAIQTKTIKMGFQNWELCKFPVLSTNNDHLWDLKTIKQLVKPKYVVLAQRTNCKNQIKILNSLITVN